MANAKELSELIKARIKSYETNVSNSEEGIVISVADGIASVSGLSKTQFGELVEFENNVRGMVLGLEEDFVGVVIFGDYTSVQEGATVKRTNEIAEVPVGDELVGRIVNPLGQPLDGGKPLSTKNTRPLEVVAPGIMKRKSVSEPLETGILAIDSMIPIGKGQRELIIGDRKTGKTAIAIDAILNQKGKGTKCIYVSIGQKNSTLAVTVQKLIDNGAMEYTTVVAANASDSDAMQYIAPYAGSSIGEEWMSKGEDVLIIFDDLSKHAVSYRTISLLLRRPPGREAYPGDVFYLHSRLLERSGRLTEEAGGGSMTALPIIETQAGDISAYIPTNVISITDGQIFLLADAFNSGQRPAVDAGLSVSRVGSAAQTKLMKKTSASLKLELANYEEVKSFAEFASDLDPETKKTLDRGTKIMELLKQPQYSPLLQSKEATILYAIKEGIIDSIKVEDMAKFRSSLVDEMENNKKFSAFLDKLEDAGDITEAQEKQLADFINAVVKTL